MTTPNGSKKEEMEALAAEFVLGLTPSEEQAETRLRLIRDHEFAAAVADWRHLFATLTNEIKPLKPPKKLKSSLLRRVFGKGAGSGGAPLMIWQAISFGSLALAAYISVADLSFRQQETPPLYATTIENAVEGLRIIAVYDPLRGVVAFNRLEGAPREGRVLQVWAILPNSAPVSLGLFSSSVRAEFDLPEAIAAQSSELTFAISDEPEGGAVSGAPSGDVLGASRLNRL
ncbi:MAG: anti-sigma factor [Roseobacter sp.]